MTEFPESSAVCLNRTGLRERGLVIFVYYLPPKYLMAMDQ